MQQLGEHAASFVFLVLVLVSHTGGANALEWMFRPALKQRQRDDHVLIEQHEVAGRWFDEAVMGGALVASRCVGEIDCEGKMV